MGQKASETTRTEQPSTQATREKRSVFRGSAGDFADMQSAGIGPNRTKTKPESVVKTLAPGAAAAPGGAYVVHSAQGGADWQTIRGLIEACTELPAATRKRLIALGDEGAG